MADVICENLSPALRSPTRNTTVGRAPKSLKKNLTRLASPSDEPNTQNPPTARCTFATNSYIPFAGPTSTSTRPALCANTMSISTDLPVPFGPTTSIKACLSLSTSTSACRRLAASSCGTDCVSGLNTSQEWRANTSARPGPALGKNPVTLRADTPMQDCHACKMAPTVSTPVKRRSKKKPQKRQPTHSWNSSCPSMACTRA